MTSIDLMISNPGHHFAMTEPVAERLVAGGHQCRIVSFCELRGAASPRSNKGVEVVRVFDRVGKSRSSVTRRTAPNSGARRLAQSAAWHVAVRPRIVRTLRATMPHVVAIPNDISFPFTRVLDLILARRIRSVLMQEGILFELPVSEVSLYGSGPITSIAAWGQPYRQYFESVGAAPEAIEVTGSPRHDRIRRESYMADAASTRSEFAPDMTLVSVVTTPIDKPGGHCSTSEKLAAFDAFLHGLAPLAAERPLRVIVRPHRGEDLSQYQRLVRASPLACETLVRVEDPLYQLLVASDAVIFNGSTVGLEAVLLGAPLGMLPIPRAGYLHDFVESGVAAPISVGAATADDVARVLEKPPDRDARDRYVRTHLAHHGKAADRVANLLLEVVS